MCARHPLLLLTLTGNHRRWRHQWRDEWWSRTTERKGVAFTDGSRFCLQHHGSRIPVLRRCERLLNCCVMYCPTSPTPGIMVWGDIRFNCHTLLVCIAGTLNSQCYITKVLEPMVLPYIQSLPSAIFRLVNVWLHVARNFQKFFLYQFKLLPWPACSTDISPTELV
ncbi:transposable element Tcb1 transposase [Trichonephila clavipes]|nr:transposable element Tcb1 transposase [Trichonephila clavipes]